MAIGNDTIVIGIYDNIEYKRASFFHELGYLLSDGPERDAWVKGLKIAKNIGIIFSIDCYKWIINQLKTYKHY